MKEKEEKWSSWLKLEEEYRKTSAKLKESREMTTEEEIAEREILGGMARTTTEIRKMLEEKVKYELGAIFEGDFGVLTARQREVAELRRDHNCREVATMLNIAPGTAQKIFVQALEKIRKARRKKEKGVPAGLSVQQEEIWRWWEKGRTNAEIAQEMGICRRSVATQIRRIRAKLRKAAS